MPIHTYPRGKHRFTSEVRHSPHGSLWPLPNKISIPQSLPKSPDTHWQLHAVTAVFYFPHYSYTCDAHHKTHHGRHHPKNLVSLAVIHDRISREYRDRPKLGKGHTQDIITGPRTRIPSEVTDIRSWLSLPQEP